MVKDFYREQNFKNLNGRWTKELDSFKLGKYKKFIKIVKIKVYKKKYIRNSFNNIKNLTNPGKIFKKWDNCLIN